MGSVRGWDEPVLTGEVWFVTRVRARRLTCSIRGIVVFDAGGEVFVWGVEWMSVIQWLRRRV